MNKIPKTPALALAGGIAVFATVPFYAGDYYIGVALTLLMWIALTESWVVLSANSSTADM